MARHIIKNEQEVIFSYINYHLINEGKKCWLWDSYIYDFYKHCCPFYLYFEKGKEYPNKIPIDDILAKGVDFFEKQREQNIRYYDNEAKANTILILKTCFHTTGVRSIKYNGYKSIDEIAKDCYININSFNDINDLRIEINAALEGLDSRSKKHYDIVQSFRDKINNVNSSRFFENHSKLI